MDHRTGLAPSIAGFADPHIAVLTPMVVGPFGIEPTSPLFQSGVSTSFTTVPLRNSRHLLFCFPSLVPVAGHDPAIPFGRSILSAECMHSTTPALSLFGPSGSIRTCNHRILSSIALPVGIQMVVLQVGVEPTYHLRQ